MGSEWLYGSAVGWLGVCIGFATWLSSKQREQKRLSERQEDRLHELETKITRLEVILEVLEERLPSQIDRASRTRR